MMLITRCKAEEALGFASLLSLFVLSLKTFALPLLLAISLLCALMICTTSAGFPVSVRGVCAPFVHGVDEGLDRKGPVVDLSADTDSPTIGRTHCPVGYGYGTMRPTFSAMSSNASMGSPVLW